MTETWHEKAAKFAKSMAAIWTAIALVAAGIASSVVWFTSNYAPREEMGEIIEEKQANMTPCLAFPDNQHLDRMRVNHVATDARVGEESSITWYELERLKECGAPCIVGWIINGNGQERYVKTSLDRPVGPCTRGKALAAGRQPPFTYSFTIPETATPGCAVFFIHLKFDEHPDRIESPWVPFTILNPDGSMPDTEGEACV